MRFWPAALCVLVLAGCANPISSLLVTKSAKEKEIVALKAEYDLRAADAQAEQIRATKSLLAAKDAQMAGAAGALYGQDVVFRSIIAPTRTDLITHNLSVEAWAAIGSVSPTADAMRAMNERLAKELDATRTTLADLQANHAAAITQNQALADQARKHTEALAATEAKVIAIEREGAAKLAAKQGELIETQGQLIAAEKARADDRAALQALKTKMSTVLGVVALAAIAGAIYLPVFKQQCGMLGAICALSAVGLWWVQPWHVAVVGGVGLLGVVSWMVWRHQREQHAATGVYRAVQAVKDSARDDYERVIKPKLEQWLTTYDRSGKSVPDISAQRHIDQRLMEVGDK